MLRAIVLLLTLWPSLAIAEARIALVIGNQAYTGKVQALKNPHNDIKAVGKALEADGFRVTMVQDATRRQMLSAVKTLGADLAKAGADAIGFLYYSGHGVARPEDHANYLIPIDLKDTDSTDFWFDAVKLDDILGELERAAPFAAHFVVFDACRDEFRLPYKSASKGFEPIAERSGMFIAFATALGAVAWDEVSGGGGPYASALAAELVKPGQDHLQLFQNVKEGVYAATDHRQVPWERNGLLKRVYFAASTPSTTPGIAPARKNTSAVPFAPNVGEVMFAWAQLKDTGDIGVLEAFRDRYISTMPSYAFKAQQRINELRKQQKVANATLPAPKESGLVSQPASTTTPLPCFGDAQNEQNCWRPGVGESFYECEMCPTIGVAPAGSFTMGSPKNEPQRADGEAELRVSIPRPFLVGKDAVTRFLFAAFVKATGHRMDDGCFAWTGREWKQQPDSNWRSPGFDQTDQHSVVCVNWRDAKAYVEWLASRTGKPYRLLSESEREYVARAGTTTPFWWGSSITPAQANYDGNFIYAGGGSKGKYRQGTVSSVNSPIERNFEYNSFGLQNVHGNVWEWTEDCWNESNVGNPGNGRPRTTGDCTKRVLRGGSWHSEPQSLRSASRLGMDAGFRSNLIGFRVARDLK
jgi:formylglycine-generating enzyme required for sulfatase activity